MDEPTDRAVVTGGTLKERYGEAMSRVAAAARRAGRSPSDVLVVAVTKYAEPDQIRELIGLGHRDFGENRVPQLLQRAAMLQEFHGRGLALRRTGAAQVSPDLPESIRWHMIGRLQRNKVRKVVEVTRLIHSVDSLRLAEELQSAGLRKDLTIDVLLQVNCSGEPQKGGVALPAAVHLADQIETMANVRLRGLMTMAKDTDDVGEVRAAFERCRDCYEDMVRHGVGADRAASSTAFNLLSMGMSNDFEVAIEEGANVVRLGSTLFGPPPAHLAEGDDAEPREPGDDEDPEA